MYQRTNYSTLAGRFSHASGSFNLCSIVSNTILLAKMYKNVMKKLEPIKLITTKILKKDDAYRHFFCLNMQF